MKTSPFKVDDELDAVFAALGHPTRRAIVARLSGGDATISELAEPFAVSLPAVSKHLLVLERAGIISRERSGRSRRCSLNPPALEPAEAWLTSRRQFWKANLQSFASFIEADVEDGNQA